MRKAGEIFDALSREKRLAANRSKPIGAGTYGVVYPSDVPGNVIKQSITPDTFAPTGLENEVNMQAIAAELGIAPRVAGLEKFPGGVGNRIEMQDARTNFELHGSERDVPRGKDAVRVSQQLGQLALKGVDLTDRHGGNVMYNNMTGRPLQLDFGLARKVEGEDQVIALMNATADGFDAAGLSDVSNIYRETVMDFVNGGEVAEAMDIAKQGFSRLQKLSGPVEVPVPMFNAVTKQQLM
jgi:hypothetical protein